MLLKPNLTNISAIAGTTIVITTALIVFSGSRFDSSWNKDGGSIKIEGKPYNQKQEPIYPSKQR